VQKDLDLPDTTPVGGDAAAQPACRGRVIASWPHEPPRWRGRIPIARLRSRCKRRALRNANRSLHNGLSRLDRGKARRWLTNPAESYSRNRSFCAKSKQNPAHFLRTRDPIPRFFSLLGNQRCPEQPGVWRLQRPSSPTPRGVRPGGGPPSRCEPLGRSSKRRSDTIKPPYERRGRCSWRPSPRPALSACRPPGDQVQQAVCCCGSTGRSRAECELSAERDEEGQSLN